MNIGFNTASRTANTIEMIEQKLNTTVSAKWKKNNWEKKLKAFARLFIKAAKYKEIDISKYALNQKIIETKNVIFLVMMLPKVAKNFKELKRAIKITNRIYKNEEQEKKDCALSHMARAALEINAKDCNEEKHPLFWSVFITHHMAEGEWKELSKNALNISLHEFDIPYNWNQNVMKMKRGALKELCTHFFERVKI